MATLNIINAMAKTADIVYRRILNLKGTKNGIATLGSDGKVPSEQLPNDLNGGKGEYYGICSTTATTAAKTVNVDSSFEESIGVVVSVQFSYPNQAANPTLKVNNGNSYPIKYKGSNIPVSTGGYYNVPCYYLSGAKIYSFVFDGTAWQFMGHNAADPTETIANSANALTHGLTIQGNGVTIGSTWYGQTEETFNITPESIGAVTTSVLNQAIQYYTSSCAKYETGSWSPKLRYKLNSSWNTATPSSVTAKYVKIGKIVFIWAYIQSPTSSKIESPNDILFLNSLPFPYDFMADGMYGSRGQLTYRYQGTITTNAGTTLTNGFYTTSQIVYASDNYFVLSAAMDQYIRSVAASTRIWISGWYVAKS